jgi:hypothetical protein
MIGGEIISFRINFPQRSLKRMTENRSIEKHGRAGRIVVVSDLVTLSNFRIRHDVVGKMANEIGVD